MNLELERFLENQTEMLGNLTITDSIDVETLTDICEEYHKRKLKLLGIGVVSNNEVALKALKAFVEEFVEAWEDGMGGDSSLYNAAKRLL